MKKFLCSAFVFSLLVVSSVFADSEEYSEEHPYRVPVYDEIEFKASLNDDGAVSMKWSPFKERGNEGFLYYKVMKSYSSSNPVYPEDDAMAYMEDLGDIRYTDKWTEKSAYYRVCAITDQRGRYCSNVVWIEKGEDQKKQITENIKEENEDKEARHEKVWEKRKAEKKEEKSQIKRMTGNHDKDEDDDKHEKDEDDDDSYEKGDDVKPKNDINERMKKAFEKAKPKLDKFLDRVENLLVNNDKFTAAQKIEKLKRIQNKLYNWGEGSDFKMMLVDYLDEQFMSWIEEFENTFDVQDMDSFFDGILDS